MKIGFAFVKMQRKKQGEKAEVMIAVQVTNKDVINFMSRDLQAR